MKTFLIALTAFFLGAFVSVYVIVLGGFSPEKNYHKVELVNDSGELISKVEIDYLVGKASVNDIEKDESLTIILSAAVEGEFTIRATFENGDEVSGTESYYTSSIPSGKIITRQGIYDVEY